MALGDIGGLHDGLNLLIWVFMGPISATFFSQSFFDGGVYSPSLTTAQRERRKHAEASLVEADEKGISVLS